jgi:hypothetical protein
VSLKNNIDFSVFSDPGSAKDLFSNSIRQALGYDSYGNKNKFSALVLSNPIPISPKDLKYFTGTAEISGSEKVSQFTYRARILGENSPHSFLPDPCDPTYAEDPEKALEIIAMHTLFVSSEEEGEAKSIPRIGSLVEVELNKNRFSYNIQQGRHVKVISSQAGSSADLAEQCDSISSIIASATDGATSLGDLSSSTEGKNGDYDRPPFTKCAPSQYPELEERTPAWAYPTEEQRIEAVGIATTDSQLAAAMLTIMSMEQPVNVGMPDFNPAGIQGDNARWNNNVRPTYQTCIRDAESYRIFLGFDTLEDGIKAFAEALKPKGVPGATGDIDEDAYNLTKWYYQNWNLAATDAEINQLEINGVFQREGITYERDFNKTREIFKEGLKSFNKV